MEKQELFLVTPGPVNIPQAVFDAMNRNMHHRIPNFMEIFSDCRHNLPFFFQTHDPVLIMGSSGTGAMETAIVNTLSPGDKFIVIESGKFGIRFAEIGRRFGLEPIIISSPYGTYPDPEYVRRILNSNPDVKAVTACHNETSTGVLAPIKEYAEIVYPTQAIFIVDTISSAGSTPIHQKRDKIDLCLSAGQKGFMVPPGISFTSLFGDKVMSAMKKSSLPKFYFDLVRELDKQESCKPEWTPPMHMIMGLQKAIEIMLNEGIDKLYKRHEDVAAYARKRGQELGFELFVHKGYKCSDTLTVFDTTRRCDPRELIDAMYQRGIVVAGGQDNLATKIVRISNLGAMTMDEMKWVFDEIESVLKDIKAPKIKD